LAMTCRKSKIGSGLISLITLDFCMGRVPR
jgi:hypothetical protein